MERRLSAIFAADMVGYSRLMEADESGTLERLKHYRNEVIDPVLGEFRGRIIKTTGDGLLAEFSSIVESIQCAVAMHRSIADREKDAPEDRRIEFRIGINLGDVIVDDDGDIYGDGVNIASRLEQLAKPGGTCVSGTAYHSIGRSLGFQFEDMGLQNLKNISRPVRVFSLAIPDAAHAVPTAKSSTKMKGQIPSIAILPFANMSGDPEQQYFADGISQDIITALSRFRNLMVIARHSSFAFRDVVIDIKEISAELGARYIIEGSVRKSRDWVRVTAQLIDGESGKQIWADRFDRMLEDIFVIQDELVTSIASTIGGQIEVDAKKHVARNSDYDLSAYDLCLRAQSLQDKNTPKSYFEAKQLLEQAIEIAPQMPQLYHQLSLVEFWQWMVHWTETPEETYDESFKNAVTALKLDNADSMTQAHIGMLHLYRRQYDEARNSLETAIKLNPNDAKAQGIYGNYLIAVGEADQAVQLLNKLKTISPLEPAWITRLRAIANMTAGNYQDASLNLKSLKSENYVALGWLASCLGNEGKKTEAVDTLEKFLDTAENEMVDFPGRSLSGWKQAWRAMPFNKPEDEATFFDGLEKAGLTGP